MRVPYFREVSLQLGTRGPGRVALRKLRPARAEEIRWAEGEVWGGAGVG